MLLLKFVAEKVLLFLVISLTAFVRAITSKKLFGFLSFLVGLMALRMEYLIGFWLIFVVTLTLNFSKSNVEFAKSDCHETKNKIKISIEPH